jgi:hypothetical protein
VLLEWETHLGVRHESAPAGNEDQMQLSLCGGRGQG